MVLGLPGAAPYTGSLASLPGLPGLPTFWTTWQSVAHGLPGFFAPHAAAWLSPHTSLEPTQAGYYHTQALRDTLSISPIVTLGLISWVCVAWEFNTSFIAATAETAGTSRENRQSVFGMGDGRQRLAGKRGR